MLADYALIDQQGKLSVLGLFQHVWVQQFPTVHTRAHLVLRVRGRRTEIGSHSIRIRFVDEAGNRLVEGEGAVNFGEPPAGVTIKVESPTRVVVSGADKWQVGQSSAEIRGFRPPEPYKGKGVRKVGEFVRRKEGKKK